MNDTEHRPVVLIVVNELRWLLTHRLPVVLEAQRRGWRVVVAAPPSDFEPSVRGHGIDVRNIPLYRGHAGISDEIAGLISLIRLYRAVRPTVVHHVTMKPVLVGSLAARIAGVSGVVNAVAGLGSTFLARGFSAGLLRAAIRTGLRFALGHPNSRVIFQNPDDQQSFLDAGLVAAHQCILIRGAGVDLNAFTPGSPHRPDPPTVILPARMLRDKGVLEFSAAARILRMRNVPCRCVLVGAPDPSNRSSLSLDELHQLTADGAVEWWGERIDMPEVMRAATIVVLPSYREGFPKVLLEASATGRPVVTTDVAGCRDAVEDGVTGVLVPVQDVEALANAIQRLLEDPPIAAQLGAAGRRRVERSFSQELVASRTVDIYDALVPVVNAMTGDITDRRVAAGSTCG